MITNAEQIFNLLKINGYKQIKQFIKSKQEENLFLDFKQKSNPENPYMDKNDQYTYARSLSGFSNALGGLIVWGIDARKNEYGGADVAQQEKPIKYLTKFLTDLNSITSQAINPINLNIVNFPIYLPNEEDTGFLVTYVGQSDLPPHMAMLGTFHYFTRSGDSFIRMDHHLLSDSFGRRQRPHLDLYTRIEIGVNNSNENHLTKYNFKIVLGVKNDGRYLAKYPAIRITPQSELIFDKYGLDGYMNNGLKSVIQSSPQKYGQLFSGGINDVVHPNTFLEVTKLVHKRVNFTKKQFQKLLKENITLIFDYEIYSEHCTPIVGQKIISIQEIYEQLKKMQLTLTDY